MKMEEYEKHISRNANFYASLALERFILSFLRELGGDGDLHQAELELNEFCELVNKHDLDRRALIKPVFDHAGESVRPDECRHGESVHFSLRNIVSKSLKLAAECIAQDNAAAGRESQRERALEGAINRYNDLCQRRRNR